MTNRVLVVTDETSHVNSTREVCKSAADGRLAHDLMAKISTALADLDLGGDEAAVLDLEQIDSSSLDIFDPLFALVRETPIVIISEKGREAVSIEAAREIPRRFQSKPKSERSLVLRSLNTVAAYRRVAETLFIEKSRAETTLNAISDSVITTDIRGNIDYLNQAAEKMTGWARADALGHPITEVMQIVNGTTRNKKRNPVEMVLQMDEPMGMTAGTVLLRADGSEVVIEDSASPIRNSAGTLCGAVIVFHDISASKAMTEKMAHLAQHDFLTDLPNRLLLEDRINQSVELAARRGTTLSVLFLDLDNFKEINDTLGHDQGDSVLRCVARRLCDCVRSSDTVSRPGGDEFILLLLGDNEIDCTATIAEKILASMAEPQLVEGQEFTISASIGISVYPGDGGDAKTLIRKADRAMYDAKGRGGNNYRFFGAGEGDRDGNSESIDT